jgi:hypothetical protein
MSDSSSSSAHDEDEEDEDSEEEADGNATAGKAALSLSMSLRNLSGSSCCLRASREDDREYWSSSRHRSYSAFCSARSFRSCSMRCRPAVDLLSSCTSSSNSEYAPELDDPVLATADTDCLRPVSAEGSEATNACTVRGPQVKTGVRQAGHVGTRCVRKVCLRQSSWK